MRSQAYRESQATEEIVSQNAGSPHGRAHQFIVQCKTPNPGDIRTSNITQTEQSMFTKIIVHTHIFTDIVVRTHMYAIAIS